MAEKNRVYYGEYTLKHWIDLILTGDIILPKYQRYFVWDKEQSLALVKALVDNQFVPPVTIGNYLENGEKQNLILDGQQRLTSILLAYLNLFPAKDQSRIRVNDVYYANENDDENDDEIDFINWDFNKLLELVKDLRDKKEMHNAAIQAGYESMDSKQIKEKDFERSYLGFSFIVPATNDSKEQQKFYSKVFRSINIEGKKLLPIESREALYYLNNDLVNLFSPEFTKVISVKEGKMDFVRYLAMLSQYSHTGIATVARGFTKTLEIYYENFIYAVVEDNATREFPKMSEIIPNMDYSARMNTLITIVEGMKMKNTYDSIIELDMYMFGLVYITIFEGKSISKEKYEDISSEIEKKIAEYKTTLLHHKNPSALKHLKQRIEESIRVYQEFAL